jgi:hypothetical protein
MIPVVLGTIASSIRRDIGPIYSSYVVTTDCAGSSPYDVYTALGDLLQIGTRVFSNPELSIPLVETTFVYNNVSYNTNNDGDISANNFCYNSFIVYADCDGNGTATVYALYDNSLSLGTRLYTDDALENIWSNVASFVSDRRRFRTDGGGEVVARSSGPEFCPYEWTVYSGCGNIGAQTVYTQGDVLTEPGTVVYTDFDQTITYPDTNFVSGSTIYNVTAGVVQGEAGPCPSSFEIYSDCDNTFLADVWNDTGILENGSYIYTSIDLSTPYEGSFVYNGYNFTSDVNGLVTIGAPCVREWITYAGCNEYRDASTPTTLYTAYAAATLEVGVTLYGDDILSAPTSVSTFIYSGMIYNLSSGVIQSISSCVYSLPYNTSGCGYSDSSSFFTTVGTTDNEALRDNSAILYTDIELNYLISNTTVYRNGYNTYIDTNVNGVVSSVNSCPT